MSRLPSIFPIRTSDDARRAQEIMETLVSSTVPEEQDIFLIFHALLRDWSLRQKQKHTERPGVHEIIRATLELRDISQRDFAKMLETSETAISALLNGRRPLTTKMARKIAQAIDLPEDVLLQPRHKNDSRAA